MYILLIEDDLDIQEILQEEFTLSGHHVDVAGDFPAAMALLNKNQYELILSDYEIPQGNGLKILEHVKTFNKKPLFFMISAEIQLELKELKELGVDRFFAKPFSFEVVLQEINEIAAEQGKKT